MGSVEQDLIRYECECDAHQLVADERFDAEQEMFASIGRMSGRELYEATGDLNLADMDTMYTMIADCLRDWPAHEAHDRAYLSVRALRFWLAERLADHD